MVVVTKFIHPESPLKLEQKNVTAVLDKEVLGCGTLFVSERTLSWQKEADVGFSIDYFNISLHAISKDAAVYNKDCVYILTDPHIYFGDRAPEPEENEDSDADSEPDLSELILVPEEAQSVHNIYESIKVCQELNPDPQDMEDEEQDDDNIYEDAEDGMYIAEPENDTEDPVNNLLERMSNNHTWGLHSSVNHGINNHGSRNDFEEEFEDAD